MRLKYYFLVITDLDGTVLNVYRLKTSASKFLAHRVMLGQAFLHGHEASETKSYLYCSYDEYMKSVNSTTTDPTVSIYDINQESDMATLHGV